MNVLSQEARNELRQKLLSEIPSWYNPYIHLAVPCTFGILTVIFAIYSIHQLNWLELLTIPLAYIFVNGVEWWAHKYLLHKRSPIAPVLYDQHTPRHHMVYVTEDMAMRHVNEMRLTLIPAYGVMLIVLVSSPLTLLLYYLVSHNVGFIFLATVVSYAVSYELLHLSYHLPLDHPIGKLSIIKKLKHHHAVHHNPRIMQNWNMNVTVPLWDFILGTIWKEKK